MREGEDDRTREKFDLRSGEGYGEGGEGRGIVDQQGECGGFTENQKRKFFEERTLVGTRSIASAMRNHPGLTREEAIEMGEAFKF